jgi:predicted nucleic acid-binding protein
VRYLLDTNIVSMLDPRRHAQAPTLIDWLDRNGASLFLSVMTVAKIDAGILKLRCERKAKRAAELENLLTSILTEFADRVLPVDSDTARQIARLGELVYRQPIDLPDLIIAATAVRHGLILLTRNMTELGRLGIAAHDPFLDLPPDA